MKEYKCKQCKGLDIKEQYSLRNPNKGIPVICTKCKKEGWVE